MCEKETMMMVVGIEAGYSARDGVASRSRTSRAARREEVRDGG